MSFFATTRIGRRSLAAVPAAALALICAMPAAAQQRVLGVDVSYWNRGSASATANGITQQAWNTAYNTPNANGYTRHFAWVRATRGGTTGLSTGSGTPNNPPATETLSRRYDDPEFLRTMTRATNAGFFAGPYHFGRPDVAGNTGTDEANHFIEYASAYMRPGYLMPVFDLEAGQSIGGNALAQFSIDFSNRLYQVMRIRPAMYINGNYSGTLQSADQSRRDQLAKPASFTPSVVGPAYPMLWNARYSDNNNPEAIPVQTGSPKTTYTTVSSYYGPWDDYGNSAPWSFWQYASTVCVPGICGIDSTIDGNVSQGDIEYVKNYLVPAVWWNDSSGDWGTMANWNSGQPLSVFNPNDLNNPPAPYVPRVGEGQTTPFTVYTLPVPRLPGTAGSGPASTSGVHDTVILERPNADIAVTLSSGTYNIRKLYMRETLNITGGSLTINYDPTYRPDNSATVLHGGPISAQFSGPVTLGGSGALNVHTLQVDATRTFTLAGGTLTFNKINLISQSGNPGKIAVTGNVNINPLNNATATIVRSGGSGNVDLSGGNRTISVGNGAAAVDLSFEVPVINGGLTKDGAGTLRLTAANTYSGGTTISAGTLLVNNLSGSGTGTGGVNVNGGKLGGTGTISGAVTVNIGAHLAPGLSPGTLTVGGVTFNSGAHFDVELAGLTPGTQHDRLVVNGAALLGGTLNVSLLNGFTPAIGNSFEVLTAGSISGTFDAISAPTVNNAMWHLDYSSNAVNLSLALAGDFNADGMVDAADYLIWRRSDGSAAGYEMWRAHYGLTTASASGSGGAAPDAVGAVPEPATLALLLLAALPSLLALRRR